MLPVRRSFRKAIASVCVVVSLLAAVPVAQAQRPEDESVLQYLEGAIAWYRDVAASEGTLTTARERVFLDNLRESSVQVLRSAFQFARASAGIPVTKPQSGAVADNGRGRNLVQAEAAADQRAAQLQTRIKELDRDIQNARSSRQRASLVAKRDKLQSDLSFTTARRAALRSIRGLLGGSDGGLLAKIDDLEQTVPEILSAPKTAAVPAAPVTAAPGFRPDSAGIVGLSTGLFGLTRSMTRVNRLMDAADELQKTNESLRLPLRGALREVIRRGEEISMMRESGDDAQLSAARKETDSLLARFKLLSAVSTPLGQGRSALNASRASLLEWQGAINAEYAATLRYLLLRLGMLGIAVLVIFLLSEVWRRATVRYVQELRRRRQILLLRRIVVGCTVALFVVLSLVTEFGSLATFAGFLAAGIAVAMQSVVVSVVAYFFLVGRWGVRVGDRVTVSGVTGDIIDIGLFRLYLMEVAGTGADRHATGRVVVFPNSVFFQPSAIFKQLPGVDYTWCTMSVTLPSNVDCAYVESRLTAAVETVYAGYREAIERQYRAAQSFLNLSTDLPRLESRLRFVDGRVEFAVRYPVEIGRASEFQDRVTRELLSVMAKEPGLQLPGGLTPKFQTA